MATATQRSWNAAYKEALDYDSWGQVEEAVGCYQRLQVAASLESSENKLHLQGPRRAAISQLATALSLRIQELNGKYPTTTPGLGLAGMQALQPFVSSLIVSDVQLPAAVAVTLKSATAAGPGAGASIPSSSTTDITLQHLHLQRQGSQQGSEDLIATTIEPQEKSAELSTADRSRSKQQQQASTAGTLRPALQEVQPGDVTLSISFGSWSVKDAVHMAQPHVLLTVRDKRGKLLEAVQESPQVLASRSGAADKLDLDFVWHLQTPLNCLPEDAAVFMELRHYKADKKKMSVKCCAHLPYDELLRPGAAMLELCRKPADYKRRGQHPSYTSKPMYLQCIRNLKKH